MSNNGDLKHLVYFADPDYYGGAEGIVAMLAEACPTSGWKMSAVLPLGDGGEVLAHKMIRAGVTVYRFKLRHFADPRLWWELGRLFSRIGGDILHLNMPYVYSSCLMVPALLAKAAGYKRVVTTEHLPMVERARRRMFIKLAMAKFLDAIIVQTEWNKNILVSRHLMPADKIAIIPNGAPEPPPMTGEEREELRQEFGVAPDDVALAIVGSLIDRKGHRFLIEALSRIGDGSGSWRLLIVGEGENDELLRQQVAAAGLSERIEFLGFRLDVRRIIHACDVLVMPSTLETQPLVINEAMSSGLPVIASSIYGIPETIDDKKVGYLVPPGEIEPLVETVSLLIKDDDLRQKLGQAARKRYEKYFSLKLMAERSYEVMGGDN